MNETPTTFQPLKKTNVRLQVFDLMKNQIVTGVWKPGAKIPSENELAKQLGVSRISIREALQKLIALDLLETRQGEGSFVKELSADVYVNSLIPMMLLSKNDVQFVLEYRKIMEPGIMGLVVERADERDIEELQEILADMKKYQGHAEQFSHYDQNFHLALAYVSKNPIIIKINCLIKDILTSSMVDIVNLTGTDQGIYYHTRILEAIMSRDKEAAQKIMEEHIAVTISQIRNQKTAGTGKE